MFDRDFRRLGLLKPLKPCFCMEGIEKITYHRSRLFMIPGCLGNKVENGWILKGKPNPIFWGGGAKSHNFGSLNHYKQ